MMTTIIAFRVVQSSLENDVLVLVVVLYCSEVIEKLAEVTGRQGLGMLPCVF